MYNCKSVQGRQILSYAIAASVAVFTLSADAANTEDSININSKNLKDVKNDYQRPESIPFPEDNPHSAAKEKLGHMLFFDPRVSGSDWISCATCHNPALGWEDGLETGRGHGMTRLGRHTPTILNLAWGELYFWDGRAASLEEQALGPIQAGVEMNQPLDELVAQLEGIAGYPPLFDDAFGSQEITETRISKAIATFERTVVSGEAPFDRWIAGESDAIGAAAKRGFVLFNDKANCAACHSGWRFTDDSFHDIGLPDDDLGRGKIIPGVKVLEHAFKTPTLREIDRRAPYMHDGSIATLRGVVDHYAEGFVERESLSSEIEPLDLNARERADLVAFLRTLSGIPEPVVVPTLPQ